MSESGELPAGLNPAWSDSRLETALHALVRRDVRPVLALLAAGRDDTDRRELYVDVLGRAGQHLLADLRTLGTLTRKWYGSQEQMLIFARERTADLPPGHPVLALVASADIEGLIDGGMRGNVIGRIWRTMRYLSKKEVRAEVDAASDRLLAGATGSRTRSTGRR